jgi:hypothetical protein
MVIKAKSKKKSVKTKARKVARPKKTLVKKVKSNKKLVAKSKKISKVKAVLKQPGRPSARLVDDRPILSMPENLYSKSPRMHKPLKTVVKRVLNPMVERRPVISRPPRIHQFNYMKAPGLEHAFEVGDTVEVFCDHEKNRERIRGWVRGIVVQVDNKMVAVQFRSNVYLTDGWMVPDRILWYPVNSEHIRPVPGKKPVKKDFIPDY